MRHKFAEAARLAHEKQIGFGEFTRRTMARWCWWTNEFTRRYRLPVWFGADDVRQELLVSAWISVAKFDPSRGKTAARYVEWNAVKRTTKVIHRARGCNQHTRKGPGRPELLECTFAKMPDITHLQTPFVAHERAELLELAADLAGGIEAVAIRALAREGSVELAGLALYSDPRSRLRFELSSQGDAVAFVNRSVDSVAKKYGYTEALS